MLLLGSFHLERCVLKRDADKESQNSRVAGYEGDTAPFGKMWLPPSRSPGHLLSHDYRQQKGASPSLHLDQAPTPLAATYALITKITDTHRHQTTSTGRKTIVAILSALRSTVAQLAPVTAQLTAVAHRRHEKHLCKRITL